MKVEDVMTTDVVAISPDTPLKEVARQLVARRISGLPVVSAEGEVLGVISEADLLVKERGALPRRHGPIGWLLDPPDADELKLDARVAGEAMTRPAFTVAPYRSVSAAAREMLERGINRLPVVRDGRLVGIVTRADLVRAFARTDAEVEADVRETVAYILALENDASQLQATVEAGEVSLAGKVARRSAAEAVAGMTASIPGVIAVHSSLTWAEDDRKASRGHPRDQAVYPL